MATIPHVPTQSDPIFAAIVVHRAAYNAYQVAPEGKASLIANDDYDAASADLAASACSSRFGALALLEHLRWWLAEEAEFRAGHEPAYSIAEARVADLTLFLGDAPSTAVAIPTAAPSGRLGTDALASWPPASQPARLSRCLAGAGEGLTSLILIYGGAVMTGFASLL